MGFVHRVVGVLKALWMICLLNHQFSENDCIQTNIFGMPPKIATIELMYLAPSSGRVFHWTLKHKDSFGKEKFKK